MQSRFLLWLLKSVEMWSLFLMMSRVCTDGQTSDSDAECHRSPGQRGRQIGTWSSEDPVSTFISLNIYWFSCFVSLCNYLLICLSPGVCLFKSVCFFIYLSILVFLVST